MCTDLVTNQKPSLTILILGFLMMMFSSGNIFAQAPVDCSINTNCGNAYCSYPATEEKGCRCFDNADNDGDGKVDRLDTECSAYYGLTFTGGEGCDDLAPTTAPFTGMKFSGSSSQNTADTQSKVTVGDIDGDGAPDAVITSKFARKLSVVATWGPQADGSKVGDAKSNVDATSVSWFDHGSGACDPAQTKPTFEHELAIADINRTATDKRAEIFAIVGLRPNAANDPVPKCYYLVGLEYFPGNGNLELLPGWGGKAASIGVNRPGAHGVADMDGDGKAEVYLRDRIYAAETGVLLATGNGDWDKDVTSGPVAADVLGGDGGKMELVVGTFIYSIPNLSNRNPATPATMVPAKKMNDLLAPADQAFVKLATDLSEYGEDTHSMCSIADIDRDGNIDVIISGALGSVLGKTTVFYWNVALNTVKRYVVPDPGYANGWPWGTGRVNIGDADADGSPNLTFVAGANLTCLKVDAGGNLSPLWTRTINDSKSGVLTVTIYDFDSDHKPELVYRDAQELVVVDGATGATKLWSATCQSHTYTEGPVIADVNNDGLTDICVTCNTNNSFDINAPLQQQALGQIQLWNNSGGATWAATRKVWNQQPYFVVNINDDMTLPFPQVDQNIVFPSVPAPGTDCHPTVTGPRMFMNVFLNQIPNMNEFGCPVRPLPDLTFAPIPPDVNNPAGLPAVQVKAPICGNRQVEVIINIKNVGQLPISSSVPVSFFNGDPRVAGATLLHSTSVTVTNLQIGGTYTTPPILFNGPGPEFSLFIVLNNNGSVIPLPTTPNANECNIENNVTEVLVTPTPFTAAVELVRNNTKCSAIDANTGELRARVYKSATPGTNEVIDYSQYTFQWHTGPTTGYVIMPGETNYNITAKPEGTYTLIVTNTLGQCAAVPVQGVIAPDPQAPVVTIKVISEQTKCSPFNGELLAEVVGGNAGITFEWFSEGNSLNVTTPGISGLEGGANYLVRATRAGCPNTATYKILSPGHPEAQPFAISHITSCNNLFSGKISALPVVNSVVLPAADTTKYKFQWYNYANGTRGSILPLGIETNPTRSGLAAGSYEVVITDIASNCESNTGPFLAIVDPLPLAAPPIAAVANLRDQTSCGIPNGQLQASVTVAGVVQDPALYTFEWFVGQNTTTPHNDPGETSGINNSIAEKVAGGGQPYTVKATHIATQCFDTEFNVVIEDVNNPVLTLAQSPNSICDPALASTTFDGALTATVTFDGVNVSLPNPNYEITWHNGSLLSDPDISPADKTQHILGELEGGKNYTAIVLRKDLECSSTPFTRMVENAKVLPLLDFDPNASTTCPQVGPTTVVPNGDVTVIITNSVVTHTYTYSWAGVPVANGGNTAKAFDIQGGQNYTVTVTNTTKGCVTTQGTPLADNSAKPTIELVPSPNTFCPSKAPNGQVQLNVLTNPNFVAGQTMEIVWSGQPAATINANPLTGLNGGVSYSATITNKRLGCTSDPVSVPVSNDPVFPDIDYIPTPSTDCDPNAGNGELLASINGVGTTGFDFTWVDEANAPVTSVVGSPFQIIKLNGGFDYTVTATNQTTGCASTLAIPLADNSAVPVISVTSKPNTFCDPAKFDGELQAAFVTNPNALPAHTFTYTWTNVTTASTLTETIDKITGKNGGDYTVKVINNTLLCESVVVPATIINDQVDPDIRVVPEASTTCTGAGNGSLTAVIDNLNGAHTYAFLWAGVPNANGGNQAKASPLDGNQSYTITVTNTTTGCDASQNPFLPNNKAIPVLTAVGGTNSVCDAAFGFKGSVTTSFFANPNGQPSPTHTYVYTWKDALNNTVANPAGVNSPNIVTGLNDGSYTVIVENTTLRCVSDPTPFQVMPNRVLPEISAVPTPSTNCPGGTVDGKLDASVTNGLAGETFSFQWYRDVVDTDPTKEVGVLVANITGQQGGVGVFYTVRAKNNGTGCEAIETVPLNDDHVLPVFTLTHENNTACDPLANGKVTGSLVAGTSFEYTWLNETTSASIAGADEIIDLLKEATFSAIVKNISTGCSSSKVFADVKDIPYVPVIDIEATPQTSCGVTPNGSVIASIDETSLGNGKDIIAGYTFEWFLASASQIQDETLANIDGNLTYEIQVKHTSSGCTNNEFVFLPEKLDFPILDLALTNITDCITPGNILATVGPIDINNDGIPDPADYTDYTFTWFFGKNSSGAALGTVSTDATPSDRTLSPLTVEGDYAVKVVRNSTQCPSTEYTLFAPAPVLFTIDLEPINKPTSCGVNTGVMSAYLFDLSNNPLSTAGFSFEWFKGYPTNAPPANFYTSPVVAFNGSALPTDPIGVSAGYIPFDNTNTFDPSTGRTIYGYPSDIYTLVVTNPNGCKEFYSENLPFITEPIVITPRVLPDICGADAGQITVDVEVPASFAGQESKYNIYMFEGSNPTLNPPVEPTPGAPPANYRSKLVGIDNQRLYSFANLNANNYTFVVQENPAFFPSGCFSAPLLVPLKEALPPVVNLIALTASTACNAAAGDGEIQIEILTDPNDPYDPYNHPPVPPILDPAGLPPSYKVEVLVGAVPFVPATGFDYSDGDIVTIPTLKTNDYTIRVTSSENCSADKAISVPNTPGIPEPIDGTIDVDNAEYCNPALEQSASIKVTGIQQVNGIVEDTEFYTFRWYPNSTTVAGTELYTSLGNVAQTAGELLNNAKTTQGLVTVGDYYLIMEKTVATATGGNGCFSAPVKVIIDDASVDPTVTLTPTGNTACSPTFFEGQIQLVAATNGPVGYPGNDPTATYRFENWAAVNGSATPPTPVTGQPANPAAYTGLNDDVYSVRVINELTGCDILGQTEILPKPVPAFTLDMSSLPQITCPNGGSATVEKIFLADDVTESALPVGEYTLTWHQTPFGATLQNGGVDINAATLNSGNFPTIAFGDFYAVAERTGGVTLGRGCKTAPIHIEIQDGRVTPTATLQSFSNTSCDDNVFEGRITAVFNTNAAAGRQYDVLGWSTTGGSTTPANSTYSQGATNTFSTLDEDTYTISFRDNTSNCPGTATTTINPQRQPIFILDAKVVPKLLCTNDGKMEVTEVSLDGTTPVIMSNFTFEWFINDPTISTNELTVNDITSPVLDATNFAAINNGEYYAVAVRTLGATNPPNLPGAGCKSAPFQSIIPNQKVDPTLAITNIANKNCDPTTFNGAITLTPSNTNPHANAGLNYTYVLDAKPALATIAAFGPSAGPVSTTGADIIAPGLYSFTVTDTGTGCDVTGTTDVKDQPFPVDILEVTPTDQDLCLASGTLIVSSVTAPNATGDYDFVWRRSTSTSPVLKDNFGNDIIIASLLPGTAATQYPTMGAGTYFVTGTKRSTALGDGKGCVTPAFERIINDISEKPKITFSTISNTACNGNFDGQITVVTTHPKGTTNSFVWLTAPAGSNAATNPIVRNNMAGMTTFTTALPEIISNGKYTIQVTNENSGCLNTGEVEVLDQKLPLEITTHTKLDQDICRRPDGEIRIMTMSIGTTASYTYRWSLDNDTNPALLDDIGNVIATKDLLPGTAATQYSQMGQGTYVVVATKNVVAGTTGSGSGCPTPPYTVVLDDLHQDPRIEFESIANSACVDNATFWNGSVTGTGFEQDDSQDPDYSFAWVFEGTPLPASPNGTTSTLVNRKEGTYVLTLTNTATGCDVTSDFKLISDLDRSTPNIVTVTPSDQTDCTPSGSAEVTLITIGSMDNSRLIPPDADNILSGAELLNFTYTWYKGDIADNEKLPSNAAPATTPTIGALEAGTHHVIVIDPSTGCESTAKEFVIDFTGVKPTVDITLTQRQLVCDELPNSGTAALLAEGDKLDQVHNSTTFPADYTFAWFKNLDAQGTSFATTPAITGLGSGNYSVVVKDITTNCDNEAFFIIQPDGPRFLPQLAVSSAPRLNCNTFDGTIFARAVPYPIDPDPINNYPFTYNYTLTYTPATSPVQPDPANPTTDFFITGLDVQTYTVTMVDVNTGCDVSQDIAVGDERLDPEVDITVENPLTNCDIAIADGQLSAEVTNDVNPGTTGYTFTWNAGQTFDPINPVKSNTNKLIGGNREESAGIYVVHVENILTNCVTDKVGEIPDATVTSHVPTPELIQDDTRCDSDDGWVTASVGGQVAGYLFSWNNGTPQLNPDFQNLAAGTYSVVAIDGVTGCKSIPVPILVQEFNVFPKLIFKTTASFCKDVFLNQGQDGTKGSGTIELQLDPADVVSDDVTWSQLENPVATGNYVTELLPGDYDVAVTTSKGCEVFGKATIHSEILSYNLVTRNSDGKNDNFFIDCMSLFPKNNVKIFNRSGVLVYEANGYNNDDVVFDGFGKTGIYAAGNDLPVGTYFYIIDKGDGSKPRSGYLELVK